MIMTGTTFRALGVRGMLGLLFFGGIMLPVGATWAQDAKEPKEVKVVVTADGETVDFVGDDAVEGTLRITGDVARAPLSPERKVVVLRVDTQDKLGNELFLTRPLEDVVKKLQARIDELKKHPDAADDAKAQIKHLMGALAELKQLKLQGKHDLSVRFLMNDGPGGENAAEINKMRQEVFALRRAMEASQKQLEAVQAKIRKLGGDPGEIPVVEWRQTPKKIEAKQTRYTVMTPVSTVSPLKEKTVKAAADKKARVKELIDKAMLAYAAGKYVECETYAKKAAEIDPNELAAETLAFKARIERRFQADRDTSKTDPGREFDPSRLASLEKRLKALQDEVDRLKKGSETRKNNP